MSYIVCRPTRREAEDYHRYYAEQNGDWEGVDHWIGMMTKHTKGRPPELRDLFRSICRRAWRLSRRRLSRRRGQQAN